MNGGSFVRAFWILDVAVLNIWSRVNLAKVYGETPISGSPLIA